MEKNGSRGAVLGRGVSVREGVTVVGGGELWGGESASQWEDAAREASHISRRTLEEKGKEGSAGGFFTSPQNQFSRPYMNLIFRSSRLSIESVPIGFIPP